MARSPSIPNWSLGGNNNDGGGATLTASRSQPSLPSGFSTLSPADPIAKLNTRYQSTYIPQLKAAGSYNPKLAYQMYKYDLARVKAGKSVLTTTAWVNGYHALHHGQPIVQPDNTPHGILGWLEATPTNIKNDIGNIAAALNPVRAIPMIANELNAITKLPDSIRSGQTQIRSLDDILTLPGVRDLPGAYTAHNLYTGDFAAIASHPVTTVFDLAPITHGLSEVWAANRVAALAAGSDEAHALEIASNNLNKVHAEIADIKAQTPNFDLEHANFINSKLKSAMAWQQGAQEAFDSLHPESMIPERSTLEAAHQGHAFQALSRASGLSKLISKAAQGLGVSYEVSEAARALALKARGVGLLTDEAKANHIILMHIEDKLLNLQKYIKENVTDLEHANFTKTQLAELEAAYRTAKDAFVRSIRKEWIIQLARNWGERLDESLAPAGYHFAPLESLNVKNLDVSALEEELNKKGIKVLQKDGTPPTYDDLKKVYKDKNYTSLRKLMGRFNFNAGDIAEIEKASGIDLNTIGIPRYMERGLGLLNVTKDSNSLLYGLDKTIDIYRYSIVTRPQHLLHIMATNMLTTLTETGGASFRFAPDAFRAWRNGEWPTEMEKYTQFSHPMDKLDTLTAVASGRTIGRILKETVQSWRGFEESVNNMFRTMNYLYGESQGLTDAEIARLSPQYERWGQQLDPAHMAGIEMVRKTSLSMDALTPIERTVIRQIFPFYAFSKFLLKFLARFPADHPWKAAMLSAIGRREMADWSSGLPTKFMDFFPVGSLQDDGSQRMIDTKSINPLRGLNGYNPFTLAGFLSELNPALQAPLELAGVNVLTATPELYPQLTVDPRTGNLVAKHPNMLPTLLETFIPPTQSIDALLGISQQYKNLKKNGGSTAEYKAFASALGFTFAFPQKVNLSQERLKFAQKEFTSAQAEEKAAMQSGQVPSDFTEFPVRNQFLDPKTFQQLLDAAQKVKAQQGTSAPLTQYIGSG